MWMQNAPSLPAEAGGENRAPDSVSLSHLLWLSRDTELGEPALGDTFRKLMTLELDSFSQR